MTSVFQAYSGFVANFQKKAILSHVGQYFRCLNLAMGSLRERLIINNTEMDEKLRDLQEIEVVRPAQTGKNDPP